MTILVDTNVLVDQLRGLAPARDALAQAQLRGDRLIGSVLSKVEILAGVRAGEDQRTRRLLDGLEWIDVDSAIAERAGALASQYLRSHRQIELADYVIAATAQVVGAELWTRNVKLFPMFEALVAPY